MKGTHRFLYLVVDVLIVDGSLEEIDKLFEDGVSLGEFKRYHMSGVRAQNAALEEARGRGGVAEMNLICQVMERETI